MNLSAPPLRQQGIALIVALLVVTIVAAMALLFTQRQQLWMRQLENRNGFTMATTSAIAAIDMTRLTLRDDARKNQVDHLLEPWTIPIPPIAVEEGHIAGHLNELQGRFNLTDLLTTGDTPIREDDVALQRLAQATNVASSDIAKLLRAYQDVRKQEPNSAPELAELAHRAGLPASTLETLDKHVVVLPEATPINVNFADAEALQASIAGLSAGEASTLIAHRVSSPFLTLNEFRTALPERLRTTLDGSKVSVQSRYFLVQVDAWFSDVHLGYEAQLRRDGTTLPTVLWVRRSALADS